MTVYEDEEIWKEIPGWSGYEVSTWGRVRSYWEPGKRHLPRKRVNEPTLLRPPSPVRPNIFSIGGAHDRRRISQQKLIVETFGKFRCRSCKKLLPLIDKGRGSNGQRICTSCLKNYNRQYLYGLTPRQYADMLWEQNNRCRICDEELPLEVDHNHSTGKIRGLLCGPHNRAIGLFSDNPELLERAADYLKKTDNQD